MAATTTTSQPPLPQRRLGGTHPSAEERLVSEESAGRTPKAVRRCRATQAAAQPMQARGVRISNIVCFAVIDCDIDLRLLAIALGARFDKGIFPSAVVWLHGTTATLSIFKKRELFKVSARVKNFKVNNVVGSASLGFRVNLAACYADNQVARHHTAMLTVGQDICNYNPTNFSGLQYRYWQKRRQMHAEDNDDEQPPTISFAVFESGKMVLTGARDFQDLVDAFEASKHVFFTYRIVE